MNATRPWHHVWRRDGNIVTHERVTDDRIKSTRATYRDDGDLGDRALVTTEWLIVVDTGHQLHIFIHESLTEGGS